MKRRYLTILMALLLALCLAACGSTSEGISRTQALFSKYSKETGVHLGLSMENDGMDTLVELSLGIACLLTLRSGKTGLFTLSRITR